MAALKVASFRRVCVNSSDQTVLDIKPDGLDWFWSIGPEDQARKALAVALAAMSAGWKLWVTLPDDPGSTCWRTWACRRCPDVG